MEDKNKFMFMYCQKIVIFSKDKNEILLAKRKGQEDYEGIFSFIGGKMEITDKNIIESMKREKSEEIGENCKVLVYPNFSTNVEFKRNDGNSMILPHYFAIFKSGEIELNEEYSEYKWVKVEKIEEFEPKIDTIPNMVFELLKLVPLMKEEDFVEI